MKPKLKNGNLSRLILSFVLLSMLSSLLQSCGPTLLFTSSQFDGVKSDVSIPAEWHGKWYYSNDTNFITENSIKIDEFNYTIDKSKLNLDDTSTFGDKIIFMDSWCFVQAYTKIENVENFGGYRVLIANKNNEGNILCWEMGFEQFIKDIKLLPVMKYEYVNLSTDGRLKVMEPVCKYIQMPVYTESKKNSEGKKLYTKILKKSCVAIDMYPAICDGSYDIDYFKKIALENSPSIVLNKDKTVAFPEEKPTKYIKKFRKTGEKNFNKEYKRILFSD